MSIYSDIHQLTLIVKDFGQKKQNIINTKNVNLAKLNADIAMLAAVLNSEIEFDQNKLQSLKVEQGQIPQEKLPELKQLLEESISKITNAYDGALQIVVDQEERLKKGLKEEGLTGYYETAQTMVEAFHY